MLPTARVLEALIGQLYLVTLVAVVVTRLGRPGQRMVQLEKGNEKAAKPSFLQGRPAGLHSRHRRRLLGAAPVFVFFPRAERERERELLAAYQSQDAAPAADEPPPDQAPVPA